MSKIPSSPTKDTIYIDVDDEITAIIDKVNASKHKIVALVLPKRATMLQSVVNMKLLKRTVQNSDKNLVLVTTEQSLLPLAGAVGLHVAPTPQSKPVIPKKPEGMNELDENDEPYDEDVFNVDENAKTPIGKLAGASATTELDTIQLDNDDTDKTPAASSKRPKNGKQKSKKDKKLKIPNFNSFRTRLILVIGALVVLIILFVFANVVLPKSSITIKTDSDDIDSSLDITFDSTAKSIDVDKNTVPSIVEQSEKTITETAEATGQRNNGEVASGSVTMTIRRCAPPFNPSSMSVPSGTGVSSGGKTYITQKTATFSIDDAESSCINYKSSSIDIKAQSPGAEFNTNNSNFTVAGRSDISAKGSASGGTDNMVKVISQSDIDNATRKLDAQVNDSVKQELSENLKDNNLYVVSESFNTGNPEVNVSAKAGDVVGSVTVTRKTTYSMVGAKQTDIEELIKANVADEIDTDKQQVLSTGMGQAVFKLQNQQDNSKVVQMSLSTTVLAGPNLDEAEIKEQIKGTKSNETKELILEYPGVTEVDVKYSPFWVSKSPNNINKIKIIYEK